MTRDAGFKRRVRARMTRTGERYAAARQHLAQASAATLHVTNGDSAAMGLRAAGLDGSVLAWHDVLHEGPVPADLGAAQFRRVRAASLEQAGLGQATAIARDFAARDRLLEQHRQAASYVLWFEADLYDQLQLIQILQRLAAWCVEPARISLVSIGEYPGMAHFGGLGELEPDALASLHPSAVAVDTAALDLASRAWQAFTAPTPASLPTIARQLSPVLRYLGEAFARVMQEYPSHTDGLGLGERRILLAVQDGAETAGEVFQHVWRRERRPYLGDSVCYASVRRLASARHPLLRADGDPQARTRLQLTDIGRQVLAGEVDHAQLNGLDRWLGGTHLHGTHPVWRYNERLETLVQT